jgi:hypothetical protein
VKLKASLASAEVSAGVVAKADQYPGIPVLLPVFYFNKRCYDMSLSKTHTEFIMR